MLSKPQLPQQVQPRDCSQSVAMCDCNCVGVAREAAGTHSARCPTVTVAWYWLPHSGGMYSHAGTGPRLAVCVACATCERSAEATVGHSAHSSVVVWRQAACLAAPTTASSAACVYKWGTLSYGKRCEGCASVAVAFNGLQANGRKAHRSEQAF